MAGADDRRKFDEALATLLALAPTAGMDFYKGYTGVLEWLALQPNPESAKGNVGAQLSLGYHWNKSPDITAFREALRALLLVKITRYGLSGSALKSARGREASPDPYSARREIISELKSRCGQIVVQHGGIIIQPVVYEWAGLKGFADIARTLRQGRDKGSQILRVAYAYVCAVGDNQGFYARWFGTASRADVQTDIRRMMDAYQSKSIAINVDAPGDELASAVRQSYEIFLTRGHVKINLGNHFVGGTGAHSSQIVHDQDMYTAFMKRHLELKQRKLDAGSEFYAKLRAGGERVALDTEMERKKADLDRKIKENLAKLPRPDTHEKVSVTGAILHEVSHNTIGTDDVEKAGQAMYGPNLCMWLARHHPNDARKNADNFRLFCEEFLAPAITQNVTFHFPDHTVSLTLPETLNDQS